MVTRRQHLEVRIRSSRPMTRSGGAPSASGGCVESCVRQISWDLVGFRDHLCGFSSVSFDLRLSSLVIVVALVRWSFEALSQWLVCLPITTNSTTVSFVWLLDGRARTVSHFRLALVFVVVARWSNNLFVIFITLKLCVPLLMIINRSVQFFHRYALSA
jgi:hypothetical protein